MRIDLANNLRVGDVVYNCFMDKLTIISLHKDDEDIKNPFFGTISKTLNITSYSYKDLYFEDLYGESDDEKSWVMWAKDNKDFFDTFDHIETMKEIYKLAFCHGFEYKKKLSYEEMMEK